MLSYKKVSKFKRKCSLRSHFLSLQESICFPIRLKKEKAQANICQPVFQYTYHIISMIEPPLLPLLIAEPTAIPSFWPSFMP